MKPSTNRNRVERAFVIAMAVLCGSLTILQYRWTGEVARAEMTSLRASLSNQVGLVCKTFDSELRKSSAMLVPTTSELDRSTREAVHIARLKEWKSSKPRPIFKRMAVVVPSGDDLELFEINPQSERLVPMAWPREWGDLHDNLSNKLHGGSPPYQDDTGLLMDFPVIADPMTRGPGGPRGPEGPRGPGAPPGANEFNVGFDEGFGDDGGPGGPGEPNGPGGPGRGEREWVILELDATYLWKSWLPDLIGAGPSPDGKPLYDLEVRSKRAPDEVIFATGPGLLEKANKTPAVDFNFRGLTPANSRGRPAPALWTLEAGQRAGALEAVVAGSRRKNLAVAVVLNALILAAGWMLLRVTQHSRRLAEEQMKFVANVTHELRTPLTVIRGAAHNLKRGIVKDQEGIGKYSGLIIEHAEALNAMVDQVLDFSAVGRGLASAKRGRVDLAAELRTASKAVESDPRFSGCHFDLQLPDSLPTVRGDPAALRRAFQNLIENAAKHGGTGGWVGIAAEAVDRRVIIKVMDHGPGIPANELDEIFTPFFRGGKARADETRGSGLGLSLVKEVAATHLGEVSVTSELGRGSTFTITLPATPA